MEPTQIKINGKTFKLRFGLKVIRLLGERLGIKTIDQIYLKVLNACDLANGLETDKLDVLIQLIIAAVNASSENDGELTEDDLDDAFSYQTLEFLDAVRVVVEGFTNSLPVQEVGKLQALSKSYQPEQSKSQHGTSSKSRRSVK